VWRIRISASPAWAAGAGDKKKEQADRRRTIPQNLLVAINRIFNSITSFLKAFNIEKSLKSRHSRAGGNPGYSKGIEKTGFPFPRE
jgi:hypothetical protein